MDIFALIIGIALCAVGFPVFKITGVVTKIFGGLLIIAGIVVIILTAMGA